MSPPCPRHAIRILVKAGWTEARIGAACGTSQSTIHRLKRNKQRFISFELGSALVALAGLQRAQHCPANGGDRDLADRQGDVYATTTAATAAGTGLPVETALMRGR